MQLTFFSARLPLTKTIAYRAGEYAIAPYPQVSRISSFTAQATSLNDLHTLLVAHAGQDHCLFNGQVARPLTDESRKGMTLRGAQREWLVFDFDKVDAADHAEAVKRYLPPEAQSISYIVQHSASMFHPLNTKFSGHIFMLLKTPIAQEELKTWYEYLNFSVPALRSELSLSRSGIALHWPLDVSAAYDSKLIYIAPPRCIGFKPELDPAKAIMLVKKKGTHLSIKNFSPIARSAIDDEINKLRQMVGMPSRDIKTRKHGDGEVLIDAEKGSISDIKPMGEHYLKFNLNGGDSMGYWLDLKNPELIKNFKGEPWLLTKEVDEKFYNAIVKKAPRILTKPELDDGFEVLAFYATNRSSQIKIGSYAPTSRTLILNTSTETAARQWLSEFGVIGQPLVHKDIIYDPTNFETYIPTSTYINVFKPSTFMTQGKRKVHPSTVADIPYTINKCMTSMLGDPSPEVYAHFMNWFAYIFQYRKKTGAAWVLSGRTGTGKGMFVKNIATPILGADNVHVEQFGALMQQFNGYLENKLLVVYEEADTRMVQNVNELMAKLRHIITDSPISIRRMNTDHQNVESHANFLFNANERTSVAIPANDRRFNFAERQETAIVFTPNEIATLLNGTELEAFADMLHRWPVDVLAVNRIIETRARADVHEATTPTNQLIAEALMRGDLQFFLDRTPSSEEAAGDFFNRFNPLSIYKGLIDRFITASATAEPLVLKEEELFIMFRTLVPDTKYFQDSRTWRKRHYKQLGLDIDKRHRVKGDWEKRETGFAVTWKKPESVPKMLAAVKENVIPINKQGRKKR